MTPSTPPPPPALLDTTTLTHTTTLSPSLQQLQATTPPTASLSSLPPECLEHILAYHRSDLTLLHALLLVNKTFFHLTIPLLYQSPFLLIKSSDRDRLPYEKFKRQVKLLWLLLSSVHHLPWVRQELPPFAEEFPVLWNPALEEKQVLALLGRRDGRSSSTMSQESDSIGSNGTRRQDDGKKKEKGQVSVRFLTVDYLNYYTHHNHSSISDALPTLFPSLICYHMDQWSSSKDMIRIRATVERALLMHRPEGIVSLAVPITRVKAVQEAVAASVAEKESLGAGVLVMNGRSGAGLRRLRRVEFYDIRQEFLVEDVLAFLDSLRRPSSPSVSGAGTGAGTEAGTMLLTEIKIGGPSDYGQIAKRGLYTILQHLSSTLKVIDLTDWRGAVMDLDQIPTEAVELLHLRLDRMIVESTGPKVVEGWLKRARKLRDLQICIGPGHGGLFRWAVERRRRRESAALLQASRDAGGEEEREQQQRDLVCKIDREERRSPSSGEDGIDDSTGDDDDDDDDDEDDDDEEPYLTTRGGSPTGMSWVDQSNRSNNGGEEGLRKLSLAGETPAVLWGLLGATTAFCDRLEVLAASSWKQPPCTPTETPPTPGQGSSLVEHGGHEHERRSHGHGSTLSPATPRLYWSAMMTRLVHLDLKGEIASVSFDMRSLAQAPFLQQLKLDTYKSDIEPALTRVPEMLDSVSGTVCELELVGPWFVTDVDLERMATVLPRLRRLTLSHCKTRLEGGEDEEEEGEVVVKSTASRLPDYLLAAMPMQQDIPSPPAPVSSRTRSHVSGNQPQHTQQHQSASTSSSRAQPSTFSSSSAAPDPNSRYLSARGLVHAVEQMTDLHYLHIGILVSTKPHPPFGTDSSSSSSSGAAMSPWDMLGAAAASGSGRKGNVKTGDDSNLEEEGEHGLCLDEKSLLRAFGAQKGSESRAFPLEVEVQECRTF